jgi:hypothetical protein
MLGIDATGKPTCTADKDTTYSGANFAVSSQACASGQVVTGIDGSGKVSCAADANNSYSGSNFALSNQTCASGQHMLGIDATGKPTCTADKDTTYSGANFATSAQSCPGGQYVSGINASGVVTCAGDANTTYSGTNFAVSNQGCPAGQYVSGVNASGVVSCAADANTTYSGSNFAISNQACPSGQHVLGISATGAVTCSADANSGGTVTSIVAGTGLSGGTITTSGTVAVNFAGSGSAVTASRSDHSHPNAGSCYTHWGSTSCASGFTAVVTGRPGGLENYQTGGGTMHGNLECVTTGAATKTAWASGFNNRLMRAQDSSNGMQEVPNNCAICCTGGCYTSLGSTACAAGYSTAYSGHIGGVEAYNGPQVHGKTLCIDDSAVATQIWASGYDTRLMRHKATATSGTSNGMESVTNTCSVCCL